MKVKSQSRKTSITQHDHLKFSNNTPGKPAIFILSDGGMILESNTEGKKLLDYSADESDERHISRLLPVLTKVDLLEKGNERVNPYLRFLSRIGHLFEVTGANGRKFAGELCFNDIHYHNQHLIMIMIHPAQYESD